MKKRPKTPQPVEFEELYRLHSREVWALVYARWLKADLALDIMQESFLRLWRQWEAGEIIRNPRAWLLQVARNLAEDHAKSSFHRNGTQSPQILNGIQAKLPLPLEKLEGDETIWRVRLAMSQIAEGDREILTLRYALDYDATKIAEVLTTTATAVHMRLSRARQRLAERLRALGVDREP